MDENAVSGIVMDAAYKVHSALGPGLFESVYEKALEHEIKKSSLIVELQQPIPVLYDGLKFDQGFVADVVVEDKIIVELKSVEKIAAVHKKQLLTYLRLSNKKLGLLINFGEASLKDGISRVVNGL